MYLSAQFVRFQVVFPNFSVVASAVGSRSDLCRTSSKRSLQSLSSGLVYLDFSICLRSSQTCGVSGGRKPSRCQERVASCDSMETHCFSVLLLKHAQHPAPRLTALRHPTVLGRARPDLHTCPPSFPKGRPVCGALLIMRPGLPVPQAGDSFLFPKAPSPAVQALTSLPFCAGS